MAVVAERLRSFEGREQALLLLGSCGLVIHAINHAIAEETLDPAPTIITIAVLLAALLYRWVPKLIVVGIALFAGITHTVGGLIHTMEILSGDPQGGDYTGPISLIGSLLLIAVAIYMIASWIARRRASS